LSRLQVCHVYRHYSDYASLFWYLFILFLFLLHCDKCYFYIVIQTVLSPQAPCSGREANLALTCPRTCGVCTSTSHSTCSLPSEWAGQWLDGSTGGPAGNQVRSAVIGDSTISVQSGNDSPNATYRCVRWDTARQTSAQMLVQTFSGGCRPRYTCAKVGLLNSFIHKISQSHINSNENV